MIKNKPLLYLGLSPLIISAVLAIFILLFFKHLPDKLPLFYSLSWGENQLVDHNQFLIIPASIVLVTLVNLLIVGQLHNQQSFFKKVLLINTFIVSLILVITFIKILLIFI